MPKKPEDTGIYIVKIYAATFARFFWEMSFKVQVESTGEWYKGDFSSQMRFVFKNSSSTGEYQFDFLDGENLIDPVVDSAGSKCMRCSRISRETWAD